MRAEERDWYLVRTQPRREALAVQSLRRLGLETNLPMLREERIIRRRRQTVTRPLFPGYLFCRFDFDTQFRAATFATGVRSVVLFGDSPAIVTADIVDGLASRMEDGAVFVRPAYRFGDRVRVLDGPLEGLDAIFEREMTDQQRVVLLFRSLTYQARVVVDFAQVANW